MHRSMMTSATMASLLTAGFVALCQEPEKKAEKKAEAPAYKPTIPAGRVVESIPLMGRLLKPGERAVIGNEPASSGATSAEALAALLKFRDAGDQIGVEGLVQSGQVFALERGTPFLVVAANVAPPRPARSMSLQRFARSIQSAASAAPRPLETLEVRVLEGPLEGKLIFVATTVVGRLIPDPEIEIEKARKLEEDRITARNKEVATRKATPLDPDALNRKALVTLRMGKTIQDRGNRKLALEYYQRVVTEFPDTPASKDAAERIKAMGAK
jgi:hypothetical protein